MPKAIDESVAKLNEYAVRAKANVTGRPIVNMLSRDRYSASFDVYLPVESTEDLNPPKEIEVSETFAGTFVTAAHWGRRNLSKVTGEKLQAYLSVRGMREVSRPFEELMGELPIPNGNGEDLDEPLDASMDQSESEGDAADEDPNTEYVTNVYFMLEPPPGEEVPAALAIPSKTKPSVNAADEGPAPPGEGEQADGEQGEGEAAQS